MLTVVTGGTGALGTPTVAHLVQAGHRVRALATGEASARTLRAAGAEPVAGSLFDPGWPVRWPRWPAVDRYAGRRPGWCVPRWANG